VRVGTIPFSYSVLFELVIGAKETASLRHVTKSLVRRRPLTSFDIASSDGCGTRKG